jgi:hypothetical protein
MDGWQLAIDVYIRPISFNLSAATGRTGPTLSTSVSTCEKPTRGMHVCVLQLANQQPHSLASPNQVPRIHGLPEANG